MVGLPLGRRLDRRGHADLVAPSTDPWALQATGQTPGGLPVATSVEAGGFYCEHLFFHTLQWAAAPLSPVGRDAAGDPLVGFLHVPGDDRSGPDGDPQLSRARALRELGALVSRTVDAWLVQLDRSSPPGSLRGLLTGFAGWGQVRDNPSGAFVRDRRHLDAALAAMGASVDRAPVPRTRRDYRLPPRLGSRSLQLTEQVLAVDDRTIDGGRWSIQRVLATAQPHFVLSLGVAAKRRGFSIELRATDLGLGSDRDCHADHAPARGAATDNCALARAILGVSDGKA